MKQLILSAAADKLDVDFLMHISGLNYMIRVFLRFLHFSGPSLFHSRPDIISSWDKKMQKAYPCFSGE